MQIKRTAAAAAVAVLALTGLAACDDSDNVAGPGVTAGLTGGTIGGSGGSGGSGSGGGGSHGGSDTPGATAQKSNGVADLTGDEIEQKAADAMSGAQSVHMVIEDGDTTMDMALDRDSNCKGTISPGGDAEASIIKQDDVIWMKPNKAFWDKTNPGESDTIEAVVGDRYIKGTSSDLDISDDMCDLSGMTAGVTSDSGSDTGWTKGSTTTANGVPCIEISGSDEDSPESMCVATTGTPYPMKGTGQDNGDDLNLSFSDWGKPVDVTPPPDDQVLDYSKLHKAETA